MDREIDEVSNRVNSIIKELEKGQDSVDRRKAEIAACERQVNKIIADLDSLFSQ
jgi:peptidoglycan hydrolase CwlO-like protein